MVYYIFVIPLPLWQTDEFKITKCSGITQKNGVVNWSYNTLTALISQYSNKAVCLNWM